MATIKKPKGRRPVVTGPAYAFFRGGHQGTPDVFGFSVYCDRLEGYYQVSITAAELETLKKRWAEMEKEPGK